MRADVKCRVDALRNDHLRLQILRVIHFVAGISDPSGGMHVHHVAHVDDFHRLPLRSRSTISFIPSQIPTPRTRSARVVANSAHPLPAPQRKRYVESLSF